MTHADRLRATTRMIEAEVGPLATLDPARELATPLIDVHERALAGLDPSRATVLARPLSNGLCELALAQLDAFPGNLFWDLDLIAASIVAQASGLPNQPGEREASPHGGRRPSTGGFHGREDNLAAIQHVAQQFGRMAELQRLYGRSTAINFAYVHDFVYGYDWAKWVAREPSVQADVPEPFAPRFLAYMRARAHQLLELIAADDAKYPTLVDEQARNPFPFSREPADEIRLHRELARRGLIPVPTWDAEAVSLDWSTRWQVPFQARRIEVARELGLVRDPSGMG